MIFAKRVAVLVFTALVILYLLAHRSNNYRSTLQGLSQSVGLGELVQVEDAYRTSEDPQHTIVTQPQNHTLPNAPQYAIGDASAFYPAGQAKSAGDSYTRGVVIGRLSEENTTWLDKYLSTDNQLIPYLYVVDDLSAPLHTPVNKGNEAMVYLTFIIDHYDSLPDVSIFMHPHQRAWHTPELLNHDAGEMLKRLSSERVTRQGYMNLRCHWDPGCPERLSPGSSYLDNLKREELATAAAWAEMFPDDPIPQSIGAPCCAQFAVARHRILNIPKEHFERYRDWLYRTRETNWISGRVFEYLWHKIFANQAKLCPDARACYCDGYGICFTTSELYEQWFDNHRRWQEALIELEKWEEQADIIEGVGNWRNIEEMRLDIPIPGRNLELRDEIDDRFKLLLKMRGEAMQNGTSAELRAQIAGRPWKEGDGY